ncbi:RDD family protein [Streptomyces sp. NPDC059783]|uniref:RDD family protein n=1 Tax=Streptomyces sp. NPDC059783 TaxID=3346944 RepID=UPI00365BC83B
MSAPTPAPGDDTPREGYYPDPSIPGYVRYWNGASWVPGTSRPAPRQGEPMPAAPAGEPPAPVPAPAPAAVEETGPVFFDEEPRDSRPEPASAWRADASRQSGFGGDHDRRVSWGGRPGEGPAAAPEGTAPADARPALGPAPAARALPAGSAPAPADAVPADRAPVDPRVPAQATPPAGGPPVVRDGASGDAPEHTVAIRAVRPGRPGGSSDAPKPPAEGTVTIRALGPQTPSTEGTMAIRALNPPAAPAETAAPQVGPTPQPAPSPQAGPVPAGQEPAGAGAWAQHVNQQARPEPPAPQQPHPPVRQQPAFPQQSRTAPPGMPPQPQSEQPVVPWKPPVDDPFQQMAAARAAGRPAALGKRFAARLIDAVVLGAVVGAAAVPLVTRAADHIETKIDAAKLSGETVTVWLLDSTTGTYAGVLLAVFLVAGFLLEVLPTAKWGRTLGKRLCGLDVRDIESQDTPGFGAATRRWLVYGVLGLLVIGVVNVVWCVFDRPWRQCWHDKAARTFVAG